MKKTKSLKLYVCAYIYTHVHRYPHGPKLVLVILTFFFYSSALSRRRIVIRSFYRFTEERHDVLFLVLRSTYGLNTSLYILSFFYHYYNPNMVYEILSYRRTGADTKVTVGTLTLNVVRYIKLKNYTNLAQKNIPDDDMHRSQRFLFRVSTYVYLTNFSSHVCFSASSVPFLTSFKLENRFFQEFYHSKEQENFTKF